MLYEYELGHLSEGDTDLFEAHLLECRYCREELMKLLPATELIREDREIAALIGELADDSQVETRDQRPVDASGKQRTIVSWLRPALVAAAVIAVLILRPWNITFHPSDEAIADLPVLAVMPFENVVEPNDTSKVAAVVTHLLETDLSESPSLRVIPSRALADMSESLAAGADSSAPEERAIRGAQAVHATWVLNGSIVRLEPSPVLATQIREVSTGRVVLTDRFGDEHPGDVFALVDSLAAEIRTTLLGPADVREVAAPDVGSASTQSALAYRYYVEGIDYFDKMFVDDARRSWERAIEIDSTFAMCYYYLARYLDSSMIDKAVKYSDRASRRERMHIHALEALYAHDYDRAEALLQKLVTDYSNDAVGWDMLGAVAIRQNQTAKAEGYLRKEIEIDPTSEQGYNNLTYLLSSMGKRDEAIRVADAYVAVAPGEPNPYDTRGDILAANGDLRGAIRDYERVCALKPLFNQGHTLVELGRLCKYTHDYERAATLMRRVATHGSPGMRSTARTELALIPFYQGKLEEGWRVLADGFASDRMEQAVPGGHGPGQKNHFVAGLVYLGVGEYLLAANELDSTVRIATEYNPVDSSSYRSLYALALAQSGRPDSAAKIVNMLERLGSSQPHARDAYWFARGFVEFARSDFKSALSSFEQIPSYDVRAGFSFQYWVGLTLMKNGMYSEAAEQFEAALNDYDDPFRSMMPIWGVKAHFYLAQAYEEIGRHEDAADQYAAFVDIWKEADPVLQDLVDDARTNLRRLNSSL